MYSYLPRELQLNIIKKMDMDARRKCGYVFKLRVPVALQHSISKTFIKPMPISPTSNKNELTLFRYPKDSSLNFWSTLGSFITIMDQSIIETDSEMTKHTLRFVMSRLLAFETVTPFLIKAGYIDDDGCTRLHYRIDSEWVISNHSDNFVEYGVNYNEFV